MLLHYKNHIQKSRCIYFFDLQLALPLGDQYRISLPLVSFQFWFPLSNVISFIFYNSMKVCFVPSLKPANIDVK